MGCAHPCALFRRIGARSQAYRCRDSVSARCAPSPLSPVSSARPPRGPCTKGAPACSNCVVEGHVVEGHVVSGYML